MRNSRSKPPRPYIKSANELTQLPWECLAEYQYPEEGQRRSRRLLAKGEIGLTECTGGRKVLPWVGGQSSGAAHLSEWRGISSRSHAWSCSVFSIPSNSNKANFYMPAPSTAMWHVYILKELCGTHVDVDCIFTQYSCASAWWLFLICMSYCSTFSTLIVCCTLILYTFYVALYSSCCSLYNYHLIIIDLPQNTAIRCIQISVQVV